MKRSILFPLLLLLSCSACGEKMNFNGKLIYAGQSIYSLSLSNGEFSADEVLVDLSVYEVNKIDDHHLLLSSDIL